MNSYFSHTMVFWQLILVPCLISLAFDLQAQPSRQLIDQRIAEYRENYPDIEFLLLYRLDEFLNMLPLADSLGESLDNIDYEHPASMRMTLVEAQEYRIRLMLENGMGSSTLFRTPDTDFTGKPYTCIITWDDTLFDQDPLAATRFMYNLEDEVVESMPESRRIDNHDFVLFSVDHEVFHCIDAYMNGPMFLQTNDPLKACCDRAKSELRADTFAAMSHLSRYPERAGFLVNMGNTRTLNLLDWDVEHYTTEMLENMAGNDNQPGTRDIRTLVNMALQHADQLAPSYQDYKQFLATVWAALQELGMGDTDMPDEYTVPENTVPDKTQVQALCDKITQSHSAIHGHY